MRESNHKEIVAWGITIFLVLGGIGTCSRLASTNEQPFLKINIEPKKPAQ